MLRARFPKSPKLDTQVSTYATPFFLSLLCDILLFCALSSSVTLPVDPMKSVPGQSGKEPRPLRPPVSFSMFLASFTPYNIHSYISFSSSDFENKFVCGEIMAYEDLKEYGSENAVKAAGKLRQQGKPYESKHHLVKQFNFSVSDNYSSD